MAFFSALTLDSKGEGDRRTFRRTPLSPSSLDIFTGVQNFKCPNRNNSIETTLTHNQPPNLTPIRVTLNSCHQNHLLLLPFCFEFDGSLHFAKMQNHHFNFIDFGKQVPFFVQWRFHRSCSNDDGTCAIFFFFLSPGQLQECLPCFVKGHQIFIWDIIKHHRAFLSIIYILYIQFYLTCVQGKLQGCFYFQKHTTYFEYQK